MSNKIKKEILMKQFDILKKTIFNLYDVLEEIDLLQKTEPENTEELFLTIKNISEQFKIISREENKYLSEIKSKKDVNEYRKDRS